MTVYFIPSGFVVLFFMKDNIILVINEYTDNADHVKQKYTSCVSEKLLRSCVVRHDWLLVIIESGNVRAALKVSALRITVTNK